MALARQTVLIPRSLEAFQQHAPSDTLTVFVHGYFAAAGVFDPLSKHLARVGVAPRQLHFSYMPAGSIDSLARRLDERVREVHGDRPVRIVGHSLGGLIGRYYAQVLGRPVDALVCLATPHAGTTRSKKWLPLQLAREIAPGSETLALLERTRDRLDGVRVCSIVAAHDATVIPWRNAVLAGHEVVGVPALAHQAMLFDRDVWGHIERVLRLGHVRAARTAA